MKQTIKGLVRLGYGVWGMGYGVILLIILVGIQITACKSEEPQSGRSGGGRGGQAVRVEAVVVQPEELKSSVRGVGILQPAKEVDIKAEIAGKVQVVYFKDGQNVKSGESLVKIEDANLRAILSRAYSRLVLARSTANRKRQLFDSGAIPAQEWETALAELRVAEADSIDAAANLLKTLIWAPFDGRLGISKITIGERLAVGDQVVKIVQKYPLRVDFSVADKYAPVLRSGMDVSFNR
ncbi:MAG: efflux RND transporter periplasmic adaptor subunit, partial [Fibromonadaceae bacterium]|nr:efflux RND transporter periplasmic adaptor subunit [Fibromonadaceae bacterium]